jgi:hypothetical protein
MVELEQRTNAERLQAIMKRKPEMQSITLDEAQRARFRELSLGVRELFEEQTGASGARLLRTLLAAIERAESAERQD